MITIPITITIVIIDANNIVQPCANANTNTITNTNILAEFIRDSQTVISPIEW